VRGRTRLKHAVLSRPWLRVLAETLIRHRDAARRVRILLHEMKDAPAVDTVVVPDKRPGPEDVAIASRLLAAYRVARERASQSDGHGRVDLWSMIRDQQRSFLAILDRNEPAELAEHLCNLARHDIGNGILQGRREYQRLQRDGSYRRFLGLNAKDKLVALAEAVGALAVENPEQGSYGKNMASDPDVLVPAISERLGIEIAPPDLDGGLLKLRTSRGLFGERDLNAVFTASLLARMLRGAPRKRICEIGAGTGRVAYWCLRFGLGPLTLVDLPHVNVVQAYYLLKTGSNVVLEGEALASGTNVVRVLSSHALDAGLGDRYDVVLNQDSFPEMHADTVREYLRWTAHSCDGVLVSINHESRSEYGLGRRHISVSAIADELGTHVRIDRYPYWLRKGYVVEVYSVDPAGSPTTTAAG
jgi:hypothetical protein